MQVDGREQVVPLVVEEGVVVLVVLVVVVAGVPCPQLVALRAAIGVPLEHCMFKTYDEYSMLLPLTFPSSHPTLV